MEDDLKKIKMEDDLKKSKNLFSIPYKFREKTFPGIGSALLDFCIIKTGGNGKLYSVTFLR